MLIRNMKILMKKHQIIYKGHVFACIETNSNMYLRFESVLMPTYTPILNRDLIHCAVILSKFQCSDIDNDTI